MYLRWFCRSEFEHHVTARDLITLQDQNDDRRLLFTLDGQYAFLLFSEYTLSGRLDGL